MRVGSLCSGYGGLDMAACAHFNGTVAWYSEIEPAGVQVLNHHHPKAQDIGDLTRLDWEQLEKVVPQQGLLALSLLARNPAVL